MSTATVRVVAPMLGILFNTGLTVSGYVNPTVAIICWALMIPVVLGALFWPRFSSWIEKAKRIRLRWPVYVPPTEAELAKRWENERFGKPVIENRFPGVSQDTAQLKGRIEQLEAENEQLRAKSPQPDDEDLIRRCSELSAEIFDFYGYQRQNMEDQLQSEYMDSLHDNPAREQKRAELIEGHNRWIVDRYSEQFGGRVSALCDDLEPRGWCTAEDRERFENPTEPQDVRYVALRLAAICDRSEVG